MHLYKKKKSKCGIYLPQIIIVVRFVDCLGKRCLIEMGLLIKLSSGEGGRVDRALTVCTCQCKPPSTPGRLRGLWQLNNCSRPRGQCLPVLMSPYVSCTKLDQIKDIFRGSLSPARASFYRNLNPDQQTNLVSILNNYPAKSRGIYKQ